MATDVKPKARLALAIALHQLGRHKEASEQLSHFGFAQQLAPALWRYNVREADQGTGTVASQHLAPPAATAAAQQDWHATPVRLFRDAVPPKLRAALCTAFAPEAPFWRETQYASGRHGYYSFFQPGDHSRGASPSDFGVIERLLQWLRPLTGIPAGDLLGAEWWVHTRPRHSAGHTMHFDTAENALHLEALLQHLRKTDAGTREGECDAKTASVVACHNSDGDDTMLAHPAVSSVIFLSDSPAADGFGPTIVLDQPASGASGNPDGSGGDDEGDDEKMLAQRAWIARPVGGSLLLFRGDLLHGVLPPVATVDAVEAAGTEEEDGSGTDRRQRCTLMIGWWTRATVERVAHQRRRQNNSADAGKLDAVLARLRYRPCAPVPDVGKGVSWPAMLHDPAFVDGTGMPDPVDVELSTGPQPVPVEQVAKPWAPVPPPLVSPELLASGLEEVPDATNQRFFIHSCADLRPCAAEPQ